MAKTKQNDDMFFYVMTSLFGALSQTFLCGFKLVIAEVVFAVFWPPLLLLALGASVALLGMHTKDGLEGLKNCRSPAGCFIEIPKFYHFCGPCVWLWLLYFGYEMGLPRVAKAAGVHLVILLVGSMLYRFEQSRLRVQVDAKKDEKPIKKKGK